MQYIFFLKEMKLFREFESACEQGKCGKLPENSINRKNCIKECVSPICYKQIYQFDEVS